jgi:hypothetical protein
MRKLALGLAVLLSTATIAEAQQHRHRYNPPQRHYNHNHHNPRVSPWVYGLGALALGAGTYYYMNQPRCERYVVGQRWNGYKFVPIIEEYCY